ncbi:MAG: winged helix-turn-helix transcriptional regulator [Lachnospiraceae bacterium]|nr:winged helix-turn-helix transcriptional regulator [Lachnospiraceae bacterium]
MEIENMPFSRRMMNMVVVYQSYIQSGIAPLKLGLSEYPILLKLAFSGKDLLLCQNEMARELHRDKALIARAVRHLTQMGYLTTAAHPYHKSKKILRLTETGRTVAYQVREITMRWDDRVKEMFAEEEWEAFLSGFEKVARVTADLEEGAD